MKMNNLKKPFIAGMAMALTLACAHTNAEVRKSAVEEQENKAVTTAAASTVNASKDFVEIEFQPGKVVLSNEQKAAIDGLVDRAQRTGNLEEILVLSWADSEYPGKNLKKLDKHERELAEKRNKQISNYIKENRKADVDTYNMAEEPSKVSKFFNTTDNKLKNGLIAAGLPTTADELQYPSKASHSVVLVKIKK